MMIGYAPVPKWLVIEGILKQFGDTLEETLVRYRDFVLEGIGKDIWDDLRHQIFLGNEAFVERMQAKTHVVGDALSVPQLQRRRPAQSLEDIAGRYGIRNAAIVAAYATGAYSYREIATYFSVHLSTVGRIVRAAMQQREN